MEGIRQWAVGLCGAALVCTVAVRLFPENTIGKQGRLVLSCVFLLSVLSPLATGDWSLTFPEFETTPSTQTDELRRRVEEQTANYVNDTLTKMANQALASYGAQVKKVDAAVNITSDGSIDIGQITVYIDEGTLNMAAVVRQVVEHRLGTSVVLEKWEEHGS